MNARLHLTNGRSIVEAIGAAGVDGTIVPWDDVLHEGPVPAGLAPGSLRERRAEFLAGWGGPGYDAILRDFTVRDRALDDAIDGHTPIGRRRATLPLVDEIVLWLEFDLYDQLQLLQILDRIPLDSPIRVSAVPDDEYLGWLPRERFRPLFDARREVTSAERLAARDAWTAFRSQDPRELVEVLPRVTVLRHVGAALVRHLQQFPALANGLSRTEQQACEVLAAGPAPLGEVYRQSHHPREEAVFMGDMAFLAHMRPLVRGERPLLRAPVPAHALSLEHPVELTDDGRRVLAGAADRVAIAGIDRWLGGVHLAGHGPVWRWDADRRTVRMA